MAENYGFDYWSNEMVYFQIGLDPTKDSAIESLMKFAHSFCREDTSARVNLFRRTNKGLETLEKYEISKKEGILSSRPLT